MTVEPIIATQTSTTPYLVYLRDKALLFDDDRKGFVMYAVQGRTWVALGDPVGPAECINDLIRSFLERCDDFGGVPVFYGVRKQNLHHYADFGLTFVKLGEEARTDLTKLTLEGGEARKLRRALRTETAAHPGRRLSAHRGRLSEDISQMRLDTKGSRRGRLQGQERSSLPHRIPESANRASSASREVPPAHVECN